MQYASLTKGGWTPPSVKLKKTWQRT